jgi:YVTN family beta-propeller protein
MQNAPQGSSPPPAGGGSGPKPQIARDGKAGPRNAVSPVALNITTPYRELGIVPFSTVKVTNPTAACNAAQNPTVFVVNHLEDSVTHYNVCSKQVIATIPVTSRPLQVRITPDGAQAIVTSFDNAITFIDTTTNQVTKILQTSIHASGIAISADGTYALLTDFTDGAPAMSVLDIANKIITGTISLNGRIYPQSVFLNPDNTLAYVTFPFDNAVEVIDIMTGTLTQTLSVQYPLDVASNPTGTIVYVASSMGTVQAIDTSTYAIMASVPAGGGAVDLNVSPDGHTITVNNFLTNSFTVFDSRVMPFSVTIATGAFPHGSAFVPTQ